MKQPLPPPAECANCGAEIPRGAKACPECGADERTGWRENEATRYDGLDLPAEAFEDDSRNEEGRTPAGRDAAPVVNGIPWYWWAVGVVLLAALLFGWLGLR